MSRLDGLIRSYGSHISVPWKEDAAPAQRVIICVHLPEDELRLSGAGSGDGVVGGRPRLDRRSEGIWPSAGKTR